MAYVSPPTWTEEQLRADMAESEQSFILGLAGQNPEIAKLYDSIHEGVSTLFSRSNNLRDLTPEILNAEPQYRWHLGYCVMPPLSADNLRTVVGDKLNRNLLTDETAAKVISTVVPMFDARRFVWLGENRDPTAQEVAVAVEVTTALLASERIRTKQRNEPALKQQKAVRDALVEAGYRQVDRPGRITDLGQLERGTFCEENLLGPEGTGAKADVPVRLNDGRILAIGCKVTNSSINSRKRLIKDVGSDGDTWRISFGKQVITAAVVSGVIDLQTLMEAQNEKNIFIVWEHNLQPLIDFAMAAE